MAVCLICLQEETRGGRGSSTKQVPHNYQDFYHGHTSYSDEELEDSKKAETLLGYGNGGETDKWMNSLDKDERDSIEVYTDSWYVKINEVSREKDVHSMYYEDVVNIHKALNKSVLTHNIVVHRGDDGGAFGIKNDMSREDFTKAMKSKEGTMVKFGNFISTSPTRPWNRRIAYHINVPKGKGRGAYIKGLSSHMSEHEYLLNNNLKYRIDKVSISDSYSNHAEVWMTVL